MMTLKSTKTVIARTASSTFRYTAFLIVAAVSLSGCVAYPVGTAYDDGYGGYGYYGGYYGPAYVYGPTIYYGPGYFYPHHHGRGGCCGRRW